MSEPAARLELTGISKRYPGVLANDNVSLTVAPGEIHCLIGENGAGKSTLMKVVYGAARPDSSEMRWNGAVVQVASPAQARKLGIGMVFQHFLLFDTLPLILGGAYAHLMLTAVGLFACRFQPHPQYAKNPTVMAGLCAGISTPIRWRPNQANSGHQWVVTLPLKRLQTDQNRVLAGSAA